MSVSIIRKDLDSHPVLLVTAHSGAVEWAARRGLRGVLVCHLDPAVVHPGQAVVGSLPAHVAAEICARGGRYYHLALELTEQDRRRELTADEMEACNARLVRLNVEFIRDDNGIGRASEK